MTPDEEAFVGLLTIAFLRASRDGVRRDADAERMHESIMPVPRLDSSPNQGQEQVLHEQPEPA